MTSDDIESEPTAEELKAAAALARALDGVSDNDGVEKEAETAALLRFGSQGELDEVALKRAATKAWTAGQPRTRLLRAALPASALLAAAVVLIAFLATQNGSLNRSALPTPRPALLRAQASATRGNVPAFNREMREYRNEMYAQLRDDYGTAR